MYNPNKISNNTLKLRIVRNLSHGLEQLGMAGKEKKKEPIGITYYLIKKTRQIITYREWYQMDSPDYIVSGTKEGCEKHKARMERLEKEKEIKIKIIENEKINISPLDNPDDLEKSFTKF